MHSSRMRTVRCSGRRGRGGGLPRGYVCLGEGVSVQGEGCLPRGRGVCPGEGVSAQGGVMSAQGGVCPRWCVSQHALGRGRCVPQCMLGYTPPSLWTEFLTHACENITFPQLRKDVKMHSVYVVPNRQLHIYIYIYIGAPPSKLKTMGEIGTEFFEPLSMHIV